MTVNILPVDESSKGGDIILQPGKGYTSKPGYAPAHGRILFKSAAEEEILRIDGDGSFFVRGRPVTSDKKVFDTLVEWLERATGNMAP